MDVQRLRRQVAFDRLLARLFPKRSETKYPWILKGGYAMELRIRAARTTKDLDLTLYGGSRLSKDPGSRFAELFELFGSNRSRRASPRRFVGRSGGSGQAPLLLSLEVKTVAVLLFDNQ